jgi:hypothetical protein
VNYSKQNNGFESFSIIMSMNQVIQQFFLDEICGVVRGHLPQIAEAIWEGDPEVTVVNIWPYMTAGQAPNLISLYYLVFQSLHNDHVSSLLVDI